MTGSFRLTRFHLALTCVNYSWISRIASIVFGDFVLK